jgi:hypothetical protein
MSYNNILMYCMYAHALAHIHVHGYPNAHAHTLKDIFPKQLDWEPKRTKPKWSRMQLYIHTLTLTTISLRLWYMYSHKCCLKDLYSKQFVWKPKWIKLSGPKCIFIVTINGTTINVCLWCVKEVYPKQFVWGPKCVCVACKHNTFHKRPTS